MLHSCGLPSTLQGGESTLQGGESRAVLELLSRTYLSQNAVRSCLHHTPAFLLEGRRLCCASGLCTLLPCP